MRHVTTLGWMIALVVAGCGGDKDDGEPPPVDAAPLEPATVCLRVCEHLLVDCFQMPGDVQECRTGCEEDLVDCTAAELRVLDGCSTVACGPDGEAVINCIQA